MSVVAMGIQCDSHRAPENEDRASESLPYCCFRKRLLSSIIIYTTHFLGSLSLPGPLLDAETQTGIPSVSAFKGAHYSWGHETAFK